MVGIIVNTVLLCTSLENKPIHLWFTGDLWISRVLTDQVYHNTHGFTSCLHVYFWVWLKDINETRVWVCQIQIKSADISTKHVPKLHFLNGAVNLGNRAQYTNNQSSTILQQLAHCSTAPASPHFSCSELEHTAASFHCNCIAHYYLVSFYYTP